MCDPSFNKPWSRYYTLWRHQGPQKYILPRAPQNLSAALPTPTPTHIYLYLYQTDMFLCFIFAKIANDIMSVWQLKTSIVCIDWLKSIRASFPCKSRHLWKRSIPIQFSQYSMSLRAPSGKLALSYVYTVGLIGWFRILVHVIYVPDDNKMHS